MSHALRLAANAIWPLLRAYNTRFERPSPHPKWAPAPLIKRRERTFPPLGWPRETDSLCPQCVKEVRADILEGRAEVRSLVEGRPGEIRARIHAKGGELVMSTRTRTNRATPRCTPARRGNQWYMIEGHPSGWIHHEILGCVPQESLLYTMIVGR